MTKRLKIGYFLKYTVNKCQVTSEMTHFIFDILGLRAFIEKKTTMESDDKSDDLYFKQSSKVVNIITEALFIMLCQVPLRRKFWSCWFLTIATASSASHHHNIHDQALFKPLGWRFSSASLALLVQEKNQPEGNSWFTNFSVLISHHPDRNYKNVLSW